MIFRPRTTLLLLPAILLAFGACRERLPVVPEQPPSDARAPSMTHPPDASPGGPPPMMSSRGERITAPEAPAGRDLRWNLPAGWSAEEPSSPMRRAQATIPGPGGPGQLVLFFFGPGQGGGTEANIQRWVDQVALPAGGTPERGQLETAGLAVTWVEAHGELQPSTTGMGPAQPQAGHSLLGAVVEGPGGPWFFKATGPTATIKAARGGFLELLQGLRLE